VRKQGGAGPAPEFAKLLEQYCLTPEDAEQDELIVPCRSVVTLSASPQHSSYRRPKLLQTTDLDVLKRWIGVPNAAVKGRCLVDREQRAAFKEVYRPAALQTAREPQTAAVPAAARMDALRAHAQAYIYGDASLVAQAKPSIENHFAIFTVAVWLFPKIKVSSGSVLLFGTGANTLLASELEIEEGGQIISLGPLTVRVMTLRKTVPALTHVPLGLEHVLRLARA
jgi:hypothetical protein